MLGPLLKSLAKDPEERWETPAEFADALQAGMASATTQLEVPPPTALRTPRTPVTPPPKPGRRPAAPAGGRTGAMMMVVMIALSLLALGTAAVVVVAPTPAPPRATPEARVTTPAPSAAVRVTFTSVND